MAVCIINTLELINVADEDRHFLAGSGNKIILKLASEIIIETHSVL